MTYYVYIYLDPRKPGSYIYGSYSFGYEPIYVGKGCNRRFKQHFCEWNLNNDENKLKTNKFRKIKEETGKLPISFFIENLNEDQAYQLERELIGLIGRIHIGTGTLTNLTEGGEGSPGKKLSEDSKLKMRLAKLGKKRGPQSEEHRQRISESQKGKVVSEETRKKISKIQIGKQRPKTIPLSIYKYLVYKDGEFLKEVRNLKSFCREVGISYSSVHKSIKIEKIHNNGFLIKRVINKE